MTQSQLPSVLLRRARAWAGQLTSLARSFAPSHVRPAISSHVEDKNEGTYIIRITANRQIAPDARAQEYGSGLWAQRGAKHWIPILPKNKMMLAFPYAENKVYPGTIYSEGKIVTKAVMHPGIHAVNNEKGYIRPAVNEIRKRGRADLQKDIKQAILGDIRRSFGRK